MSELVLKSDDAFRVASRHYIHTLNSQLLKADGRLETVREEAALEVDQDTLEQAYPHDLFSQYGGDLDAIEEEAARIAEAGESYRVMALEVQAQFTQALMKLEAEVTERRGTSAIMDSEIDVLLTELYALLDVPTFIRSSIDRRSLRCQELLESPSPSRFTSLVGVDFTQKAGMARAIDRVEPRVAEAEEEGMAHEMNWEEIVEHEVSEMLWEDLFEEATERIKDAFVENEARTQVLTSVMEKVNDTLLDKLCPKVYDALCADHPTLTPA